MQKENALVVSASPHIRCNRSTRNIMLDVIIALMPATLFGIYAFGTKALMLILSTVLACVVSEYIIRKIMKRDNSIKDYSAVLTGLLLALNFPPTLPLWISIVGGVIAIVIVKQAFGGLGQNFMNPALAARVILFVSWPTQMTSWVLPGPDSISSATPLALIKNGEEHLQAVLPSYMDLFIGNIGGCIGEISTLAILLGALYLFIRKVISYEIPVFYLGTVAVFMWIFGGNILFTGDYIYHLLSGGLIIGAFFMATDYTTSPITKKGKIIIGIGCGLLTCIIRLYTNYPEGVSFAIILMNICVPLIDRYTVSKSFGGAKRAA